MSFSADNPVPALEFDLVKSIISPGKNMLELGNKKNDKGTYKKFFKKVGLNHVSVDWNGRDGSIKLDLRQIQNAFLHEWYEFFDIVTNFGTTEHVIPQKSVWENILNALKVGGHLVSVTPLPGDWKKHQESGRYPTQKFYEKLAQDNRLIIETVFCGKAAPKRLICVRLKKTETIPNPIVRKELIFING